VISDIAISVYDDGDPPSLGSYGVASDYGLRSAFAKATADKGKHGNRQS
jgi:hypothetical protein